MTFFYDSPGRCVKRRAYTYTSGSWALTSDTCLYYDRWNLAEERDTTGSILGAFSNDPEIGEVLARFTSINTIFFHGDAQNNTIALSDANGSVLERYRYDTFGSPCIYDSQFSTLSNSAYGIRHLFQGREWLESVMISDHLFRYYSPDMQRWLSRDPIAEDGDLNIYRFVLNIPTQYTDAVGLAPINGANLPFPSLSGPFNGWWSRLGGPFTGFLGAGIGAAATIAMNNCPNCPTTCQSCCQGALALGLIGNALSAAGGCIGTAGWGCGFSILANGISALATYNSYQACVRGCPPSSSQGLPPFGGWSTPPRL